MAEFEARDVEMNFLQQLPEALVEKIITGIPFPHILKARQLSKEWRQKFARVARQISPCWPEYFPAFLERDKAKSEVQMFDAVFNRVYRIGCKDGANERPLGRVVVGAELYPDECAGIKISGTLLAVADRRHRFGEVTVINLLTRQRRTIKYPFVPTDRCAGISKAPVLNHLGNDTYELIFWYWDKEHPSLQEVPVELRSEVLRVNVYNSRSETWAETLFSYGYYGNPEFEDGAFVDGCLHVTPHDKVARDLPKLMRFDTLTGTVTETARLPLDDSSWGYYNHREVVICGSRILAVMIESNSRASGRCQVKILQLDTHSFALVELSRTTVETSRNSFSNVSIAASAQRVYVLEQEFDESILCIFDVNSNTWSRTTSTPMRFCASLIMRKDCFLWGPKVTCFVVEPATNPFVIP